MSSPTIAHLYTTTGISTSKVRIDIVNDVASVVDLKLKTNLTVMPIKPIERDPFFDIKTVRVDLSSAEHHFYKISVASNIECKAFVL